MSLEQELFYFTYSSYKLFAFYASISIVVFALLIRLTPVDGSLVCLVVVKEGTAIGQTAQLVEAECRVAQVESEANHCYDVV